MSGINARYPDIKRLREDEGLTWREIGERFGISPKTANQIYHDPAGAEHVPVSLFEVGEEAIAA